MSPVLTDAQLRKIQPPARGLTEITDAGCRGLVFRVTAAGISSFSFRFRDRATGRSERLSLGRYPGVSLRDARRKADALRGEIDAGKNPAAHKRQASDRTFAALADRYLTEHAKRFKRSVDADERNLRVHILPYWGNRDFTAIERADVIALVERIITAGKPIAANRVQALISSIFSFAIDADLVKANPCARLRKRGRETAKTRTLTDGEIGALWRGVMLPPVSQPVGLALRLVLALGCRPGEVAGMARSEIEFDQRGAPVSWTVPASRSKNRKAHYVPLPPLARDLVVEALKLSGSSAFVFPSPTNGGPIAGHALSVAMARLGRGQQNPPTPHDLRRTCATRLSAGGVPAEDVAVVLNHVRADITGRHYDHYQRADEKRAALQRWSKILTAIIEPQPLNVIALRA
jgi:integrase